ncbi:MAG TPA: hypothetical protein VIH90_08475 [Candidatus Saccharimonadales bacterium]
MAHRSLGLSGEAGIIANLVKKAIRDNDGKLTDDDIQELQKRLGDVLYYAAVLAEYFDIPFNKIAKHNLEQSQQFKKSRAS